MKAARIGSAGSQSMSSEFEADAYNDNWWGQILEAAAATGTGRSSSSSHLSSHPSSTAPAIATPATTTTQPTAPPMTATQPTAAEQVHSRRTGGRGDQKGRKLGANYLAAKGGILRTWDTLAEQSPGEALKGRCCCACGAQIPIVPIPAFCFACGTEKECGNVSYL